MNFDDKKREIIRRIGEAGFSRNGERVDRLERGLARASAAYHVDKARAHRILNRLLLENE